MRLHFSESGFGTCFLTSNTTTKICLLNLKVSVVISILTKLKVSWVKFLMWPTEKVIWFKTPNFDNCKARNQHAIYYWECQFCCHFQSYTILDQARVDYERKFSLPCAFISRRLESQSITLLKHLSGSNKLSLYIHSSMLFLNDDTLQLISTVSIGTLTQYLI